MQRPTATLYGMLVAVTLALPVGFSGCAEAPGTGGLIPFNLPPVPVITSDVVRGVAPLTVKFNSDRSTDDGLILSRLWDFGDGSTSQEISPRHTFGTTGDFTVTLTLTDNLEAAASRTLVISVTEAPVAVISVDPTTAEAAPAVINFDGSASFDPDGEIVEYQWDFGDGSREFLQIVAHVYASPGSFRAKLTVTDDKGVTASSERLIAVGIPTPTIEIRVPPPDVSNIVLSTDSPAWIQAVYSVEPGTSHFVRAGIDRDTDQCQAQSILYDLVTGDPNQVLTGHEDRVTDVAFAPSGTTVATAGDDGTVRSYNSATGDLIRTYTGQGRINAVAFSPDGQQLVWGQSDGDVVLAEVGSGTVLRTFVGHSAAVNAVVFSPDGTRILSGSNDRRALLWNVADGTVLRDFQHSLGINAVAFSPGDPTMVATGSEDGTIKIWNTTSGAELLTLTGHNAPVNDLAFSSDGLALISASDDNTARAWSPFLGVEVTTYAGHEDAVLSVAISPDATRIVTGGADGTARVWDSGSAELLRTVQPCESPISAVEVSPDGLRFLVGVAARNDIQLDTDPPDGNDLNITYPQGLSLQDVPSLGRENVPSGTYYLWAEIDTDQTEPVRAYANATINVVEEFTSTVSVDTPIIPLLNNQASVVVSASADRQIFDLGPLDRGDRVFLSLLSTPGYGEFYIPDRQFSIMVLDADWRILVWYQALLEDPGAPTAGVALEEFVLFTPDTKLVVGHNSLHYYVVVDGGVGVNVRIERDTDLFEPRQQRVLVKFKGSSPTAVAAGNQPPRIIPELDAADFNGFFGISPGWGDDETEILKLVIMQTVETTYAAYNIELSSDDDLAPDPPFQTVYVGGSSPDNLLGISDYVDPRNETTTGTAIAYATEIAERGIGGNFTNPINSVNDLGAAIGRVTAHEIGHLLGLRNTDDATDIMQGFDIRQVGDPTMPRILKAALVAASEQSVISRNPVVRLPAIGIQDAPLLLQETVGRAP